MADGDLHEEGAARGATDDSRLHRPNHHGCNGETSAAWFEFAATESVGLVCGTTW